MKRLHRLLYPGTIGSVEEVVVEPKLERSRRLTIESNPSVKDMVFAPPEVDGMDFHRVDSEPSIALPTINATDRGKSASGKQLITATNDKGIETSINRMKEDISELEDQSIKIYDEVKRNGFTMSLIMSKQNQILTAIEELGKNK
jgi:uncharacterized protein (UPF0335 family)